MEYHEGLLFFKEINKTNFHHNKLDQIRVIQNTSKTFNKVSQYNPDCILNFALVAFNVSKLYSLSIRFSRAVSLLLMSVLMSSTLKALLTDLRVHKVAPLRQVFFNWIALKQNVLQFVGST